MTLSHPMSVYNKHMKKILIIISVLLPMAITTAQDLNTIITDPATDEEILYGYCDWQGLTSGQFNEWFGPEYESYEIDEKTLSDIDLNILFNCNITIVLGTWCSDSQREVPRFYRILDYMGFPGKNLKLICVDRTKDAAGTEIMDLSVDLVPTFIIYSREEEIGRIIEAPVESLEADLVRILK
jgi:hypothetical protein